jgi:hypothetical protein
MQRKPLWKKRRKSREAVFLPRNLCVNSWELGCRKRPRLSKHDHNNTSNLAHFLHSTFEGGRGEWGGGVGGLEKRIDEQRKLTQGKKGQFQSKLRNFYNGRRTHEIRLFYVIIINLLLAVVSKRVGSTVATFTACLHSNANCKTAKIVQNR